MKSYNIGINNSHYKDGRCLIKHYCIDCNKEVVSYRTIRCPSCENKRRFTGKKLTKGHKLKISKSLKQNIIFPTCLDCGKPLSRKDAIYCILHSSRHKKLKGRKRFYCIDCKKEISYTSGRFGNRRCLSCANKGENNPRYIDGRTELKELINQLEEYRIWRFEVLKRDNYECQECNKKGIKLEVHHIKELAKILQEFLEYYNIFSPIEDKETLVRLAILWKDFWNINNGITLCGKCHRTIEPRNIKEKVI